MHNRCSDGLSHHRNQCSDQGICSAAPRCWSGDVTAAAHAVAEVACAGFPARSYGRTEYIAGNWKAGGFAKARIGLEKRTSRCALRVTIRRSNGAWKVPLYAPLILRDTASILPAVRHFDLSSLR
jgi:hypothetical protein